MASFRYSAYSASGDVVAGTIEAQSRIEALRLIHDRGMFAFEADEAGKAAATAGTKVLGLMSQRFGPAGRVTLVRDLATLLKADVAIDQALRILAGSAATKVARSIVRDCLERVAAGQRLTEALRSNGSGFRSDELAMIAAGEQNGSLAAVLDQLARLLERRLELGHRLTSALIYPVLLVAMSIISVIVIITVLIPNIQPLFEGNEAQLPAVVSLLLTVEDVVETHLSVILASLCAITIGIWATLRRPGARQVLEAMMLRLPIAGGLMRKSIASRICLTLATLIESGVPLQQSLAAATSVARNRAAREALDQAAEQVVTGIRLSQSLSRSSLFEESSLSLVALGEETNRLGQMLHHVAATTEAQVVRQLERGMTLLTPVLTLALGIMVGGIIMSIMQAILSINEIALR
jgi:general secretion pathway protein F